jgi:hypothetical protein
MNTIYALNATKRNGAGVQYAGSAAGVRAPASINVANYETNIHVYPC